jgi:hypothetical protein
MAFSSSSYFAGVATAFVAVGVGFAGGALVTTSAVQPPNRLDRVASSTPLPQSTPSSSAPEQPNAASVQESITPPASVAVSRAVDAQPAQQAAPAEFVAAGSDTANRKDMANKETTTRSDVAAKSAQPAPPPAARSENASAKAENAAPSKNERANARSIDSRRETYRKRANDRKYDDRKYVERKRRQDLDEATNTVRQLRPDRTGDQVVVEREEPTGFDRRRPRFSFFGNEDDSPRSVPASSPFVFFGDN